MFTEEECNVTLHDLACYCQAILLDAHINSCSANLANLVSFHLWPRFVGGEGLSNCISLALTFALHCVITEA